MPELSERSRFSVLHGDVDGHPVVALINAKLRNYASKGATPWFLSISTPILMPTANGLPGAGSSSAW
jgi:hypothetical protein